MSFNAIPSKVFISYAHEDEECAKRLYNDLKAAGLDPWLDKKSILPGEDWKISIRKGIRDSKYFMPLLSSNSVERRGYVQKELKQALEILEEMDPLEIFVIPIRLDNCKISNKRINSRQIEDLSQNWNQGIKRVLKSIGIDKQSQGRIVDPLKEKQWTDLLGSVDEKNCIPFLGEELPSKWLPVSSDISSSWTREFSYPFEDCSQLPLVAQFLALAYEDNNYPKKVLSKYLKDKKIPDFSLIENRDTPYAVLAGLDLPIYITTNYDHCMESALKSRGKEPVSEFCRWNEKLSNLCCR